MWEDWGSGQLEAHETLSENTKGNKRTEQKRPPSQKKDLKEAKVYFVGSHGDRRWMVTFYLSEEAER